MSDEAPLGTHGNPYKLRGANCDFFQLPNGPAILCGPAETGKTITACLKLHTTCMEYSNTQALVVRKVQSSMVGSVVRSLERVIGGHMRQGYVRKHGGSTPERYFYDHNGSTVWICGMDNETSVLSSERDIIYVNQTEELSKSEWETLSTRCTGRGSIAKNSKGEKIAPMLYGDCNPSGTKHWIREMANEGKLALFNATHRDNPSLYNDDGSLTDQGVRTMNVLEALTGVRALRLFKGIWSTAEGSIYDEFNPLIHVCERKESEMVSWYLCLDFGFSDPAVVLLVGSDYDRRWHIFKEFYETDVLPEYHMEEAVSWNAQRACELAACDGARPDFIAWLQAKGVNAVAAEKGPGSVDAGIALLKNRLHPVKGDTSDGFIDGRPRLTVSRSCEKTIAEFESYVMKPGTDKPLDKDNHAMDALRYLAMRTEGGSGAFTSSSSIYIPPATGNTRIFTPRQFTPRQL